MPTYEIPVSIEGRRTVLVKVRAESMALAYGVAKAECTRLGYTDFTVWEPEHNRNTEFDYWQRRLGTGRSDIAFALAKGVEQVTYLEELQQAVTTATKRHQDASEWLAAGATYDHKQRELERAEREAATMLDRASQALKRALRCAVTSSHQGIKFEPHPWHARTILAWCPDCVDYDFDGESYIPCHETGEGDTESEALEDYHDRCGP